MEISKELNDNYEKALSALKRENYDYAINLFSNIIAIKQDFAKARHYLRIAQRSEYKLNPPGIASKILVFLISIINTIKAIVFKLKNEPALSVREYEKILSYNPFSKSALLELGKTFLLMGLNESAMYTFEELSEISPKNLFVLKNLGKLYQESGNYEKSRSYYKKVMEIHPYDHDAEKGLRNLDALGTIRKSYSQTEEPGDFKIRI